MEQKNKWHPETPKECTERNEQIVKALIDDPKWKNRAKTIQNCDKYDPCMDVLCSRCRRDIRTAFVGFIDSCLSGTLFKVDLIEPVNADCGTTEVKTLKNRLRQRINRAFSDVDVKIIGAYDISFDEDGTGQFTSFWSPHWHLIVSAPKLTRQDIHERFAQYFYATNEIQRS